MNFGPNLAKIDSDGYHGNGSWNENLNHNFLTFEW